MKYIVFWICLMLAASTILMIPATVDPTFAARGCCMQKGSDGRWFRNGMNFNQCRSANRSQDNNDDFYSPNGTFWWNVNC